MTIPSRRGLAAALCLALAAPRSAHAAGFAIFEQGARAMGFAGAATAQSADPSAIFHNAAGIAFLKGRQVYVGGTLVHPSTTFTGADPFPGAATTEKGNAGLLKVPSVYYTQSLSPWLVIGVGVNAPFGLKTEWAAPSTFSGRFISQRAELKGVSVNPTIAYRLADRLSVGAGVDIRFSKLSLRRSVPVANPFTQKIVDGATADLTSGTATGFGFNVGLLGKPSEDLALGIAYRHKVKVDYTGTATFGAIPTGNSQLDARVAGALPAGAVDLQTGLTFPGMASAGAAWTHAEWTFEGDVDWYQWSTFDRLDLAFAGHESLDQVIPEAYKNSWQFRFGAERPIGDAWTARGGYFFDQTPSPRASMSPLLPDASRHGMALGATWRTGRLRLDGAGWYVLSPQRSTNGESRDGYDGAYKSHALTLGVSLGYAF